MDLEEVVLKAGSAYSDGKYEEALQFYQRAVLCHPHNAVLHANISAILSRLSRHDEALHHAETAVNLQPKWGKASYRKGEALRHLGDHRAALLSFCTALRYEIPTKQCLIALKDGIKKVFLSFPFSEMEKLGLQDDPFALLATIGQLFLSEGSTSDAIKILTWSLQLDCSCMTLKASALACLGSAHYKSGNPRRAVDYYEQQLDICMELGNNDIPVLRNIAMAAEAACEWELALSSRRKIFNHKDLSPTEKDDERQNIAELLLQMGRGEEAYFMLEMKTPENLRARINLVCAKASTGDGANTISALLTLRPMDEQLFARVVAVISRCFVEEGRLQDTVNYLEEVIVHTIEKEQLFVWKKACSLCSKTYLRMGNVESSLNLAKQLLRMGRNSADRDAEVEGLKLLAAAYEQQGDFNSGLLLLQNILPLLKSPVEKTKLYLELARVMKKAEKDPSEYLGSAVDSAECTNDSQVKVQAFSQALRHFKEKGQLGMAENLLQRQKDLLHYDLDGTTRSIIFEDLAFMAAEEGGSTSSVLALEHSLAEAQEANNIHRELELLERMGDELGKLEKKREAEGFYHRFLALAKQLRIAEHIQRGHEKLARQYRARGDWNLCAEHARYALTLAKVQQEMNGRISMLLLIAEAETEKNDLETALYVLKKAQGLAEAAQLNQLEAISHQHLAKVYKLKGENKQEIEHKKKFISLSQEPTSELCDAFISLASQAEAVEAVGYLKRCMTLVEKLEGKAKHVPMMGCFSAFLEMNLIDEAIRCLKNMEVRSVDLEGLFELPLTRQLPFLMYLNEKKSHDSLIHARLLLLGINETCDISTTCSLISAWNSKNWSAVLQLLKTTPVDLSIVSSEALELMEMTADWYLSKRLPENLEQLSNQQKLYLHSLSWSHPVWSTVPFVRNQVLSGEIDFLSENVPLLEKIICSVLSDQTDLVPMWFEELLAIMRSSFFSFLEWTNPRQDVLVAAVFVALAEEDPLNQIWILERAKWELDKHLISVHGHPPPPMVSSLNSIEDVSYHYSLGEVDLVWTKKEGALKLFMTNLISSLSFYVHLLSKFLRHKGVANLDESQEPIGLLISNRDNNIQAGRIAPWIRNAPTMKRACRRIWLLSMSSLLPKGAVRCEDQKKTLVLKKIADSHIVILDPEKAPNIHEILSTGASPDVVLSTGPIPFEIYSAFLLMDTSVVIEAENPTQVAVQIFVDQLRMGDPVSICASHLKCRLYGDPDYRIESDATLGQLRRIIREDTNSFLLLARSWRQDGRQGEPWTVVAKGLITLSEEQMSLLIPLLEDYSTDFVNKIYCKKELLGKWEALNDPNIKEQWALLYSDHLYLAETNPVSYFEAMKHFPVEDSGYASDEYMVARRSLKTQQ